MEKDTAESQAKAQLESIIAMVAVLNSEDDDEARERINEDALSVEVRSGWQPIGEKLTAAEFNILLCTGGPAVRIVGTLSEQNDPQSAVLEYQNWGTPWTEYRTTREEENAMITYASQFGFDCM